MFGGRIVRMRSRRRRNAAAREAMTYACNKKMRSNIGPVGRLTEIRFASKQNLQNSVVSTFGVGRCNKARRQKIGQLTSFSQEVSRKWRRDVPLDHAKAGSVPCLVTGVSLLA